MRRLTWVPAAMLALVACSSGASVHQADDLACDADQTSLEARSIIERVGGLRTDDYVVRFAESTEVGVVALVDRDPKGAFDDLRRRYGVTVVAQIEDDGGEGAADGFAQVQSLVDATCDQPG